MKRILDKHFEEDLIIGQLNGVLNYIKKDHTLDMEIRNNCLNIYYRGGSILRIKKSGLSYQFKFEEEYLTNSMLIRVPNFHTLSSNLDWNNYFPKTKQVMDFYFSKNRNEEKEYQQLVVRENNYSSISNGTDYFIIDIEYDNHEKARFDLIAVEWPSVASKRKLQKRFKPKLVIIEMKYGDGALTYKSGMKKHYDDFNAFTSNTVSVSEFNSEMIDLFKQKRRLGLIPCLSKLRNSNKIENFDDQIDLIFLIANHDPASRKLGKEIESMKTNSIKFIVSNFMGYGIYNKNIYNKNAFSEKILR